MAKKQIKIVVAGAMGRMGQAILKLAARDAAFSLHGALEAEGHPQLGEDVGALLGLGERTHISLSDTPEEVLDNADCLITFTTPEATRAHVEACLHSRKSMVIGTTGLEAKDRQAIEKASKQIAIVQAPNMSIGVNLLLELTRLVAGKLDKCYDIEIVETHHRMKKDAPSGTALALAEEAARARGTTLSRSARYGREGMVGARPEGEIGILARRGGDVIGEHIVEFLAQGERIGLFHQATSRDAFASGALTAAKFVAAKKHGLWSMKDVLGL